MNDSTANKTRRQFVKPLAAVALLSPLLGCAANANKEKKMVGFHFVTRNYTDVYIFDVALNGYGGGGAPPFGGGNAVMMGMQFELDGPQELTWRDAGSGVAYKSKTPLFIRERDIPTGAKTLPYLCVHLYPDQTAELTYGLTTPTPTPRGLKILKETST